MSTIKLVDPPEGWRYGFPKQYVEKDGSEPKNLKEWLVRNGYPQSEIDSYGDYFHCRFMEMPVEVKKKTIHGKFSNFVVGTGTASTFISDDNNVLKIVIMTLTQEDGSGNRFLINYNTDLQQGYVDFKTRNATIQI